MPAELGQASRTGKKSSGRGSWDPQPHGVRQVGSTALKMLAGSKTGTTLPAYTVIISKNDICKCWAQRIVWPI